MKFLSLLAGWRGALILAGLAALLSGSAVFYVSDAIGARRLAQGRLAFAQYREETERASRAALVAVRAREAAWAIRLHQLQTQFDQETRDAEAENRKLRADIDTGARRLRIQGMCPAIHGEPADPAAATSRAAAAIELAPDAGRAVLDLREAIMRDQRALRACQAYAREISGLP